MSNINLLHANLDFIKSKPTLVVTINNSLKDTERKVFYTDTPFLVGFSAPLLISCKITCKSYQETFQLVLIDMDMLISLQTVRFFR